MNKLIACLAFVIVAIAALASPPARAQLVQSEPLDRIVAIVDEDVILQSELDRALATVVAQYSRNPGQLPPRDILERQVLERLIMQKLQLARGESTGVKVSDIEIDQALAQIGRQNNLSLPQLRAAIQQQGLSYDQFRKNVRDELVVQHLHQRVVQSRVQVSDTEVESAVKNGSTRAGQIRVAHLLVGVPDGASPEQIDAARKKADDVKRQIDGGMDFSAAAIRFSDAQDALEGGDLGWRGYDEVPNGFADVVDTMQIGQVSAPIRGPSGFHILKLVDKRAGGQQMVTETHARHIMVKVTELTSSEQAEKIVEGLRKRIAAGEDFAKLAKEKSEDESTANLGGDMGWFQPDAFGPKVAETLKDLKDGELTPVFQTESGWHLMQLLGRRTEDRTAAIQRDQAKQVIFNRKGDEEYENFLRQIKSEAYIEIRLPGADAASGAHRSSP